MRTCSLILLLSSFGYSSYGQDSAINLSIYQSYFDNELLEWTQQFDNFHLENFEEINANSTGRIDTFSHQDWSMYWEFYNQFMYHNSDSSYSIDLSFITFIEERDGKFYGMNDVDQSVQLCINDRRTSQELVFCGTPCKFDEGIWVDDNRFILLGNVEDFESDTLRYHAYVFIFDFDNNTKKAFENKKAILKQMTYYVSPKYRPVIMD